MSIDYQNLRREYLQKALHEDQMQDDPMEQFAEWFQAAVTVQLDLPNAMALATSSKDGVPSVRYVLLKGYSQEGFVFYSNSTSATGEHLQDNPVASLVFYWAPMDRQIRVDGHVQIVSEQESDDYFSSRPGEAQISAAASPQSSVVNKEFLEQRVIELTEQYKGQEVPRPPEWIGYRVVPYRIEFWQGREHRLHDRILYTLDKDNWQISRLAP
jgi:pyridoxamine 5'-phosphate oxidase